MSENISDGVMRELMDFAAGKKTRTNVMHALKIDDYGMLLRMLNAANLPHPMVSSQLRKSMVDAMVRTLR